MGNQLFRFSRVSASHLPWTAVGICSVCGISDGYTTEDLIMVWKYVNPLSIKENLELPEFGIADTSVGDCVKKFSTGIIARTFPRYVLFFVCVHVCGVSFSLCLSRHGSFVLELYTESLFDAKLAI